MTKKTIKEKVMNSITYNFSSYEWRVVEKAIDLVDTRWRKKYNDMMIEHSRKIAEVREDCERERMKAYYKGRGDGRTGCENEKKEEVNVVILEMRRRCDRWKDKFDRIAKKIEALPVYHTRELGHAVVRVTEVYLKKDVLKTIKEKVRIDEGNLYY